MNSSASRTLAVEKVRLFGQHRGEVNCSAFSPDGRTLLTASDNGCVYSWETKSKWLLWRLEGHTGPVNLLLLPDSHLFASSSCDCTICLWDIARVKCLHVLKGELASQLQPRCKAAGVWDKKEMLWEVQCTLPLPIAAGVGSRFILMALLSDHWFLGFHCTIWDLCMATPAVSYQELEGHNGDISCPCYSGSGLLVSGSWDKTIRVWKPTNSSLLLQLKGHIAFSPDELNLASAGYSHMVSQSLGLQHRKCPETLKVRLCCSGEQEPVEGKMQGLA
uniref:WD repeat domain 38 n=1 Tax=Nannospalax galili TaxID=1026970 RepID=A0A8C6R7Y0_NANGA